MQTSALVNSSGFNFYIYWRNNKFLVVGRHGFYEDDVVSDVDLTTSSDVFNYLKEYIQTWCCITLASYETFESQSEIVFHQVFTKIDSTGDKGTTLVESIELLQR